MKLSSQTEILQFTCEQHKLSGELVTSPIQAQQLVQSSAIIIKPVIKDKQARDDDNYSNKAIKL